MSAKLPRYKYRIPWSKPSFGEEEEATVLEVMRSGWMSQGKQTKEFEEEIADGCKVQNAVVVHSGTSALLAALLAAGIKPGDDVLVPTFTFAATANVVLAVGANPILVDCDLKTFNVTPSLLEEKRTPKTKALIFVDIYGMPCDTDGILSFSHKHNLIVIEDAAQGLGAEYKGRPIGSGPDFTVLSFHMAKLISTVEGGCILTNHTDHAKHLRQIRNHGMRAQYEHVRFGLNLRTTDIQSAIGRVQLRKLQRNVKHRQDLVALYKKSLQNYGQFQEIPSYVTVHPHMIFSILLPSRSLRDRINSFLNANGIETRICFTPVHQQTYHRQRFADPLPNATTIANRVLSLPLGNSLSKSEIEEVIEVFKKC